MTELIRDAYRHAVRTRAVVYGWTTYARRFLDSTNAGSDQAAAVPSLPHNPPDESNATPTDATCWTIAGNMAGGLSPLTATVDQRGTVITAKDHR